MDTIKRTPLGESYWNGQGAYKEDLDSLLNQMPLVGSAETLNGELIRAANRLYYDYCNNGNGNAAEYRYVDDWGGCDDDDYEDGHREWNPYYEKFYRLILDTLETVKNEFDWNKFLENMKTLERMTVDYEPGFEDKDMAVYDYMMDAVVWYVLNHPDRELPASYDKDIVKH